MTLIAGAFVIAFTRCITSSDKKAESKHLSMKELFKNRDVRSVLTAAVLHGVMKDNISLWMTVYFVDKFNVNLQQSALFVLFIPVIGFIGRMLYPVAYSLSKQNEHKVSQIFFFVCAAFALLLSVGINSPIIAAIALSIIYASVSVINTSILSIYPVHFSSSGNVASVSGLMDFATYFGAGISSVIYGYAVKNIGYTFMFASWTVASLISVFVLTRLAKKSNFKWNKK